MDGRKRRATASTTTPIDRAAKGSQGRRRRFMPSSVATAGRGRIRLRPAGVDFSCPCSHGRVASSVPRAAGSPQCPSHPPRPRYTHDPSAAASPRLGPVASARVPVRARRPAGAGGPGRAVQAVPRGCKSTSAAPPTPRLGRSVYSGFSRGRTPSSLVTRAKRPAGTTPARPGSPPTAARSSPTRRRSRRRPSLRPCPGCCSRPRPTRGTVLSAR